MSARRIKIMLICDEYAKLQEEHRAWHSILEEHLGKKAKAPDGNRIETPYAIIDFVISQPIYTNGYKLILKCGENDEWVLSLATGEENL